MFKFVTGNLLESEAVALVNTVNCEGFMGKGLAYQFKQKFPATNSSYVSACKIKWLRPGKVHLFREKGKIIINFPTKDTWRAKSKMEYIETGLDALLKVIEENDIQSIAIPPLGSGNGGLDWNLVKLIIIKKLEKIQNKVDILIYEPNGNISPDNSLLLDVRAYLLMDIKERLQSFTKMRLEVVVDLINLGEERVLIEVEGEGLNSLSRLCKNIKVYEKQHEISTSEAKSSLYKIIVSKKTDNMIEKYSDVIIRSCNFVNILKKSNQLELVKVICKELKNKDNLTMDEINAFLSNQVDSKGKKYEAVDKALELMYSYGFIDNTLLGFQVKKNCIK